jgi:hypothetical protein
VLIGALDVLGVCRPAEENHWHCFPPGSFLDSAQDFDSIEFGHIEVEDYEIRRSVVLSFLGVKLEDLKHMGPIQGDVEQVGCFPLPEGMLE